MKLNCWEVRKCGFEPAGKNVDKHGICPAAKNEKSNGINFGKNGGRACWALADTLCCMMSQKTFAKKIFNCIHCSFYNKVLWEEGKYFVPSLEIHERMGIEYYDPSN